jgi:hypothetical protein
MASLESDPISCLELALKLLSPHYKAHAIQGRDELEQQLRLLARSDEECSLGVRELACVVAEREIARRIQSSQCK